MTRNLYESTAAELATGSVEHVSYDTAPDAAAKWLETNGYDAAPVNKDGDPVGFIHESDIDTEDTDDTLETVLTPLTINYIISGDTTFAESLAALIDEPIYFLGGHNQITGILTRADLNTPPARMYLFDRITYLEEHLRELISAEVSDWKQTPVSTDELDGIEDRYADAKAANVELSEIYYAQFSTLSTIVSSVESCWQQCGFSTTGEAQSRLHDITELRNDVAHANLLVENTDSDEFLSSGRTTENLYTLLGDIERILTSLADAGYAPEIAAE